jgi:hypothetical protein
MIKFILDFTIKHEGSATIMADSLEDAKEKLDSGDSCLEFCDTDIVITECCQSDAEIDNESCPAEDKWEELTPLARAIILKDNGVSDEAAMDICDRDYLSEIDEEWWEYFDEE